MNLTEVARKRAVPGIIIFDQCKRPVFFNQVALSFLNGASSRRSLSKIKVPPEISDLFDTLKNSFCLPSHDPLREVPSAHTLFSIRNETLCCRGFYLNDRKAPSNGNLHIMMLIDKISKRHEVDLSKFKDLYDLTSRQMEIISCLTTGLNNKGIADQLHVCEDTIKAHMKHIMKQLKVKSRTEILSMVFEY